MAVIRALTDADLPAVFEALETQAEVAYSGGRTDLCQLLARVMEGGGAAVIAIDVTGQLLEAAAIHTDTDRAELVALWVTPTHRRRGLARGMLSAFTPVWSTATITATAAPKADVAALADLLRQFAFTPTTTETDTASPSWRTRRVRRTTGRSSLVSLLP